MPGSSAVPVAEPLLAPPAYDGDDRAVFQFTGSLLGRDVTWQCELVTLARHARDTRQSACRQYLDIRPTSRSDEFVIRIGLMLPVIDAAAVARSIIMVRKYRRLAPGRHEYGAMHAFQTV
jgi:hypothetical protein